MTTLIMSGGPLAGMLDGGITKGPLRAPAAAPQNGCVRFAATPRGPALINLCRGCRLVAVERSTAQGRDTSRTNYLVAPRSSVALPRSGGALARIVGERACR